jgi:preprotein translocase subunit SecA
MFEALNSRREEETVRFLSLFEPISIEDQRARQREQEEARRRKAQEQSLIYGSGGDGSVAQHKRDVSKVGRNDPCPCGSGKKFKKCHGK